MNMLNVPNTFNASVLLHLHKNNSNMDLGMVCSIKNVSNMLNTFNGFSHPTPTMNNLNMGMGCSTMNV